MRRLQEIKF